MPFWNERPATQTEVDAALAAAAAAQASADASMKIAANGSDINNVATFRANLGTVPAPLRASTTARYALLSYLPFPATTQNLAVVDDIWRFAPFAIDTAWTVDQLAVVTTIAAAAGTAAMIFGLFAVDAEGKPTTRQADYSTYGSIDLTAAPGVLTLSTPGLIIPAGRWAIGYGWAGTAGTNPTMSQVTGLYPSVSSSPISTTQSGWQYAISGASVPANVTPAAQALTAPAVWVRNP